MKMADFMTPKQRSNCMSRVRGKNTTPELTLRKWLWAEGFRFRLHSKLPGKPDIVLPKYKTVIFVHGCFWHHHEGCRKSNLPKTNVEFWQNKIESNIRRDKANKIDLEKLGWKVFIAWECEIKKNAQKVLDDILTLLKSSQIPQM